MFYKFPDMQDKSFTQEPKSVKMTLSHKCGGPIRTNQKMAYYQNKKHLIRIQRPALKLLMIICTKRELLAAQFMLQEDMIGLVHLLVVPLFKPIEYPPQCIVTCPAQAQPFDSCHIRAAANNFLPPGGSCFTITKAIATKQAFG